MADVVPGFRIPPGFKAIRLKPDDTPFFGWQTEDSEPDDDYRSMGKVSRKGYGLVDTDPRNNARIDDELVAKYGEELISGWVERTPGGGFHIPVRLPEDLWDMPQSQNGGEAKQLPSLPYGVDIKVGGKGYGLAADDPDGIRPIILFQAQNRNEEVTVAALKRHLMEVEQIAEDRIAVATGDQRELDGINLFDPGLSYRGTSSR